MNQAILSPTYSQETARCPYCCADTSLELPSNYRPVFAVCDVCASKFIAERLAKGFQVMTVEEAPCSSNPDCREIEIGGYDEE